MNIIFIILSVLLGVLCSFQYVLIKRLAKETIVDPQTELKNYRWLKKRLELLIKKSRTIDIEPLSLAIIDIDNFRRFNKKGIRLGDEVLYEFAAHLNNLVFDCTGTHNLVRYRLGDEFAIVFENCNKVQADDIMKKILNSFVENFIKTDAHPDPIYISFSYGLAQFGKNDTFDSFIERIERDLADQKSK
jgi:diguanylate cyclase (GGDEF)-like protein